MIAIVDYGLGNILAFVNVYKSLNVPVQVARAAEDLVGADKIILPGVGSFDHAMQRLNQSGMRHALESMVLHDGIPLLGVCVGMQMLGKTSEEGKLPGLGWVDGSVRKFGDSSFSRRPQVPQMGWNDVRPLSSGGLFRGMEENARFYFLHSYVFHCHQSADVIAVADYGGDFSCAVNHGNVYGVQFHPEKSHSFGSRLLKNFAEI